MRKIIEQCPGCGAALKVTAMQCSRCGTGVTGRFDPCVFCKMTDEQSTFVKLFVQRRGNLSEMEKALGISYPTVRNKLEEIIRLLQGPPAAPVLEHQSDRAAILSAVASGQLSTREALEQLQRAKQREVGNE